MTGRATVPRRIGAHMADGISNAANYVPLSVSAPVTGVDTDVDGVPLPPGTSTADFFAALAPDSFDMAPVPGAPAPLPTR